MAEGIDQLGVKVCPEGLEAVLTVPGGFSSDRLDAAMCQARLAAEGIGLSSDDQTRLETMLAAHAADPAAGQRWVVSGVPPQHGRHGQVVLLSADGQACQRPESLDALAQQPFMLVQAGDTVARLLPPETGSPGRDLFGGVLAARPGRSATLQLDESLVLESTGLLRAQHAGSLVCRGTRMRVHPVLTISRADDLGEPTLRFDGDVHVLGDLGEGFHVNVQGSLAVGGRVDDATLRAGLDLILPGGMITRASAGLYAGRDCRARYLHQVTGQVRRDLWVEREMVGCHLGVGGRLHAPEGRLVGGEHHLLGGAVLGELGSAAGVRTVVHPGSAPQYHVSLQKSEEELATLATSITQLEERVQQVRRGSRTMTAQAKEELTEWMCRLADLQERQVRLLALRQSLETQYLHQRRVSLAIGRSLHPGVVLVHGEVAFTLTEAVAGPLEIFDRKRELCLRRGAHGPVEPVRRVARVASWEPGSQAAAA